MRGSFFDGVADVYDRTRPGYPDALVDAVLAFARPDADDRALEIGCGTGQATEAFAARGLSMTCLEPGPNLAARARARLAAFPAVDVRCETFEAWPLEREAFALVIAARSLHWVAPRVRYAKTARALRRGGALAVFRNDMLPGGAPVDEAVRAAMGVAPSADRTPRADEFGRTRFFERPESRTFEWARLYDAATYADLLRTKNRLRDVPDRERRLTAVQDAIEQHGGTITVRYATRLHLARRAARIGWWPGGTHRTGP